LALPTPRAAQWPGRRGAQGFRSRHCERGVDV